MSDGPYRVVEDLGTAAVVDGDGLVLDRYKWNELGRIKADEIASFLNAAHRAASEKAQRVVEAARELLRLDEDGYMMRDYDGAGAPDYEPMLEKMRSALADYDKGVSNEAS